MEVELSMSAASPSASCTHLSGIVSPTFPPVIFISSSSSKKKKKKKNRNINPSLAHENELLRVDHIMNLIEQTYGPTLQRTVRPTYRKPYLQ